MSTLNPIAGSTDRYQTFFLCGTHWKEPQSFIHFMDWIVTELKPQFVAGFDGLACVLTATRAADYGKRNPSFSGDYLKLSGRLEEDVLESFVVVAGVELQLHIKVEFLHLKNAFDETDSSKQSVVPVPTGIKIVSMSLRKDIWQRCQETGLAEQITRR